MGLFEDAEKSLTAALKIRRESKVTSDDDIAAVLNTLGMLYNSIHNFDEAEKNYSEALEIHKRRSDTEDRNLSMTMVKHNLQRNAIQGDGKLPSAEDLQETISFFKTTSSWWMTGQ